MEEGFEFKAAVLAANVRGGSKFYFNPMLVEQAVEEFVEYT